MAIKYAHLVRRPLRAALRISFIYLALSLLWIVWSDQLLAWWAPDAVLLTQLQSVKGVLFVCANAVLLYVLIGDALRKQATLDEELLNLRARNEAVMRSSEAQYRLMFTANPIPMFVVDDATLRFLAVNEAAVARYGYTEAEFLRLSIKDIRPVDDVARAVAAVRSSLAEPDNALSLGGNWFHCHKDGDCFPVNLVGSKLDFNGREAMFVIAQDLTERQAAQAQLQLTAQVFEASRDGIIVTDADNRILSVNQAFTDITGYTAREVIGRNPRLLSAGRLDKAFYVEMWQTLRAEGHWQGEVWNRRKSGEVYPEWLSVSAICDEQGQIVKHIGIMADITSRKSAEERIRFLSNFDSLTGLPNRALLEDRARVVLAAARREHTQVALLYMDLDRFKNINDAIGLAAGDRVLRDLAARLSAHLRPEDTLCRPGGDEFILLLPDTDAQGAAHVADKLRAQISQPLGLDELSLNLSVSIGIALYPDNGQDYAKLSQCADAALFRAKQEGRNSFQFFTPQMHERAYEIMRIEHDLHRALENAELRLHYQPKVDARDLRIVGLEALVRWQHPEHGMVSPAKFIPVAEECGLIREIGDWVLQEALQQTARWQAAGLEVVPVAVNLSMLQFHQPRLHESVAAALQQARLPPALLELELTESIALGDTDFTIDMLDKLHVLGVALSIDDFGTGYSSLSYLRRFQLDKLKIDQSFVRDLDRDPQAQALLKGIIVLARSLGFRTVAEGVETQAQLEVLRREGCDEIQGYVFSKPLPADEVALQLAASPATAA